MTNPKRIMVVEDEEALQRVLVEWLRGEGYEALGATTGAEALDLIPRELPDLILLDIILPEVNGFEVMIKLRSDPVLSKIPIIVLTNLGDEEDRKRALELGAKNYLVKAEYDFESMRKIISETLSSSGSSPSSP